MLLVPGEDAVAISACAIDLLAMHGDEPETNQNLTTSALRRPNLSVRSDA